jgi:hypothetical protein
MSNTTKLSPVIVGGLAAVCGGGSLFMAKKYGWYARVGGKVSVSNANNSVSGSVEWKAQVNSKGGQEVKGALTQSSDPGNMASSAYEPSSLFYYYEASINFLASNVNELIAFFLLFMMARIYKDCWRQLHPIFIICSMNLFFWYIGLILYHV